MEDLTENSFDFTTYLLCEKVDEVENEPMTNKEQVRLANVFNEKFGRYFIDNIKVEDLKNKKDKNAPPEYIGFRDTAHFKARFIQRHPDMDKKKIKNLIKTIGLGAKRKCSKYFETGNKNFSVLVYSQSKKIGMYVKFHKGSGDTPYILTLVTVLPKESKKLSRSSDVLELVESINRDYGWTDNSIEPIVYIDDCLSDDELNLD